MNKQEKTSLTLPSVGGLVLFQPCSVLIPLMLPLVHLWAARPVPLFQQSLQSRSPLKTHQCCCFLSRTLLGIVEFLNGILRSDRYFRLWDMYCSPRPTLTDYRKNKTNQDKKQRSRKHAEGPAVTVVHKTCKQTSAVSRDVTKISSCQVNTTDRWGIKQLLPK